MFLFEAFHFGLDDRVDEGISKQDLVEVAQIGVQLIVEGNASQRKVYIFSRPDGLIPEYDLLDLLINPHQHLHIRQVEHFEVIKERLQLEQS